jgi:hypothetical protein
VSREPVIATFVEVIDDVPRELRERDVQLLVLDDLWPLRDAVAASTLRFSMIRMRNALASG